MTTAVAKHQTIRDAEGDPIAAILPIEESVLVEDLLDQRSRRTDKVDKLASMEQAAKDPLFLADLRETMPAFTQSDGERL